MTFSFCFFFFACERYDFYLPWYYGAEPGRTARGPASCARDGNRGRAESRGWCCPRRNGGPRKWAAPRQCIPSTKCTWRHERSCWRNLRRTIAAATAVIIARWALKQKVTGSHTLCRVWRAGSFFLWCAGGKTRTCAQTVLPWRRRSPRYDSLQYTRHTRKRKEAKTLQISTSRSATTWQWRPTLPHLTPRQ